jgi:hypothetical protein
MKKILEKSVEKSAKRMIDSDYTTQCAFIVFEKIKIPQKPSR